MKTRKDIELGESEKFVEDIRQCGTRCPKCGGVLIANLESGIEFCAEDDCDYEVMKEVGKALKLLTPLLRGLAEGRNEFVDVYAETDTVGNSLIVVMIDEAKYEINVTAENVRSMVRSVVDKVALKL